VNRPSLRPKALAVAAALFLAGALCGVGGASLYFAGEEASGKERKGRHLSPEERHQRMIERTMERLVRTLELESGQTAAVREEVERYAAEVWKLNKEVRPRFKSLFDERAKAIERHLEPWQIEKFRADRERYWKRKSGGEGKGKGKNGEEKEPSE